MATFEVDVGGSTYEVDAPDENTAWKWANKTHSQSSSPVASIPQKTQEDFAKETLDEMPWAQRQLVGAGGALHKGYQGIKGLFGGEVDQDAIKYADVAGREAPIGSMVGEIAKYAPAALAGTAVLPAAAASAALGFAYDPTGNRFTSAATEGAFGAGGALIGKAIPRVVGSVGNMGQRLRELMGGDKAVRYYGGADKAADASKTIIGLDNQVAASRMLGEAGDVRTAQALAGMPDAEGVAALDKLMRSKAGIQAADDPMAASRAYLSQAERQGAAQGQVMEEMAQGGSAESAALARDLYSKLTALDLKPVERDILNKLAEPGRQLKDVLPVLESLERRYRSALQNQGRMATEAGQQQVLAQGSRATERQVVNALPEGNYPRQTSMPVSPAGTPEAARMSPAPFQLTQGKPRFTGDPSQFYAAADELGGMASGLRSEADILRQQISELPSTFTAAPVRNAIASMSTGLNATKRNVAAKVAEELRIAGDDPVKIAELRAMTINTLIPDLVDGSNSQKAAAAALTDIKKVIDKQLGPDYVEKYLKPYSKALAERDTLSALDELRLMQKDSPKQFIKTIAGENTDFIEKYSKTGKTMMELLGDERFAKASGVAGEMARDRSLKKMAKSPEAKAAVAEVLSDKSITRHLPNMLNRYVVLANTAIQAGEMKVNKEMYRELDKAMRDPKAMKALIDLLPPEQRSKMIGYAAQLGKGVPVTSAAYGEQVRK